MPEINLRNYTASGNIYGALLDANKQRISGYLDMGEAWPVKLKVEVQSKQLKSSRKGMRGQIVAAGGRINGVTGTVGIKNWNARNIAMLLAGRAVEQTAASGAVSDQGIVLPKDGSWIPLGRHNVSSVTIAGKSEGTDFEVQTSAGFIRNLTNTEISGQVSFSYAGLSGYRINIADTPVIRMAILIDGKNDETSEPMIIELDSVVFTSNSEMAFISEPEMDYEEMEFNIQCETLISQGKTSPGTIDGVPI